MNIRKQLNEMYIDWVNEFLTIERFAEYYGITVKQAYTLLALGLAIHEEGV